MGVVGLFASNLRHLLLTPPLMQYLDSQASAATAASQSIIVCGVDPGYAHGHKVSSTSNHARKIFQINKYKSVLLGEFDVQ